MVETKLVEENLGTQELTPFTVFTLAIESPATKEKYLQRFEYFLNFANIENSRPIEIRCDILAKRSKSNVNWLINTIYKYLQHLKKRVEAREISGATLRNYVKPIRLFFQQIDLESSIPWKRMLRGMPKGRRYANDRAPMLEEIRKLCEYPDRRIRCIVYVMASSGMRLGGFDFLRWEDISPIIRNEKLIAAKMVIYSGEDEEYFSFITAEAYKELANWMEFRASAGEKINGASWVMRDLWDVSRPNGKGLITIPKKLKSTGIKRLVERALYAQGIRQKLPPHKRRHDFQADHGFRKWFKTRCELAGMNSINIETLMAHSIGISDSYYRATEEEILQDYLKAESYLTINIESELREQLYRMQEASTTTTTLETKLSQKESEIVELRQGLNLMSSQMQSVLSILDTMKAREKNNFAKELFKKGLYKKET